jgi:diaminopimelate epimerase
MTLKFDKYQGAGNDFVIVNNLDGKHDLSSEQIARLCDRRFGIGADGLILVEKSNDADFAMKFYNSDGKTASMCGNGGRCIARYAFDNGIAAKTMKFAAEDGLHEAEIIDSENVRIKMINVGNVNVFDDGMWANTGVPHFVIFVDDIDKVDIATEGRKLADDKRFAPDRTNVNFTDNANGFRLRTYERGVEGETLACGTGTVATALCINTKKGTPSPIALKAKGGLLKVYFEKNNNGYENIWLEGPAVKVFKGEADGK